MREGCKIGRDNGSLDFTKTAFCQETAPKSLQAKICTGCILREELLIRIGNRINIYKQKSNYYTDNNYK